MAQKRPSKKSTSRGAGDAGTGPDGELRSGPTVRSAFISGNGFHARAVRYVEVDGDALFEGDIVLGTVDEVQRTSDQLARELRGEVASAVGITGSQFRWPNCTVPFDIDPALPNQARVTDAIAHWQANTAFQFVLRTPGNAASFPDWVTFQPSGGCSSSVGRRGNQQFVNLGTGCTTGNAIHEIGHTVGLWHEQSREDRDAFVTVHWDKIQPGFEHNFDQHITDGDDIGGYDYGSIMHYPRNAFSIDGSDTITPLDPTATVGQRVALSAGDIAAAVTFCPTGTGSETIKETIETVKEHIPETVAETVKERVPETIKERIPETGAETVKERIPETIKERAPETGKERAETTIEHIPVRGPFGPVSGPVTGGQLPFAMRTAHQGGFGDLDPSEQLLAQLAAVNVAIESVAEYQATLAEQAQQLADALTELGWQ